MTAPQVGPELDAAVGRLLGLAPSWDIYDATGKFQHAYAGDVPTGPRLESRFRRGWSKVARYPPVSTDWTAMRLLIDALEGENCEVEITLRPYARRAIRYAAQIVPQDKRHRFKVIRRFTELSATLPEALCRAALAAMSQEGSES